MILVLHVQAKPTVYRAYTVQTEIKRSKQEYYIRESTVLRETNDRKGEKGKKKQIRSVLADIIHSG